MWLPVDDVQVRFSSANPSVPVNTLQKWLTTRDIILIDAHFAPPLKVRNSNISAARLVQYKVGQFELVDITLYKEFERSTEKVF